MKNAAAARSGMAAVLLIPLLAPGAAAQGPPSGLARRLIFENEYVRVERITIPAGHKSGMHTHARPAVEVFLTDDHVRETFPDGASQEHRSKAGVVAWNPAATHQVENLSAHPVELLAVEIKGRPANPSEATPAPGPGMELENPWVRVTRGRIAPRQKGPMHSHPRYVGILLTETKLRATLADGATREITGQRGDASWREPVTHQIENLLDTPFEAIDVNLKTMVAAPATEVSNRTIVRLPTGRPFRVNGTDLAYVSAGRGETVVLVHGSLCDYRIWEPQMVALAQRFGVIAYSRRCHTPNACPQGSLYSFQVHVDDLAALIRALNGGPVHAVGHSYGAAVVALLARQHPELLRSMVLIEPGLASMLPPSDEGRRVLGLMAAARDRARQALAYGNDEEANRQLMDFVLRPGKSYADVPPSVRAVMLANAPSLRAAAAAASGAPATQFTCEDARAIAVRTLLLEGENTAPEFRLTHDEFERCLPNRVRIRIPGASHGSVYEAPAAVTAAVLRFLQPLETGND